MKKIQNCNRAYIFPKERPESKDKISIIRTVFKSTLNNGVSSSAYIFSPSTCMQPSRGKIKDTHRQEF